MSPTYSVAPDKKSITCLVCGKTSHNQNDVAQLYCGHCHRFHEGDPVADIVQQLMPGSVTFQTALLCPACGHHFPAGLTDPTGQIGALKPGAYTICGECLTFLEFDDKLQPQIRRAEDIAKLPPEDRDTLKHVWALTLAARLLGDKPDPLTMQ